MIFYVLSLAFPCYQEKKVLICCIYIHLNMQNLNKPWVKTAKFNVLKYILDANWAKQNLQNDKMSDKIVKYFKTSIAI